MRRYYPLLILLLISITPAYSQWSTSGTNIYNTNTGNVGIGTTSPNFRLHLKGANANSELMTLGATTTGNFALTSADGGAYGLFAGVGGSGNAWLQVGRYDSNTAYNLIMQAACGNVGIGTTTPGQSLEVAGNVLANKENSAFGVDAQGNARLGIIKKSGYYPTISSDSGSPIIFSQSNQIGIFTNIATATVTERMRIDGNGNVGIGNSNPQSKLDIAVSNLAGINISGNSSSYVGSDINISRTSTGTGVGQAPAIQFNDNTTLNKGLIQSSSVGLQFFYNTNNAGWSERMRIASNGYVGIGNTAPDAPLTVSGQVHAQEVKVTVTAPGPDYVFEPDYKLTSLDEIKNYIDQNKHLPEVPSAKEMEKNGVQLGEMNMLLLKKIEELTLYVIELKKENEKQQNHINALESKIEGIKK